jgi:hypothetical protein
VQIRQGPELYLKFFPASLSAFSPLRFVFPVQEFLFPDTFCSFLIISSCFLQYKSLKGCNCGFSGTIISWHFYLLPETFRKPAIDFMFFFGGYRKKPGSYLIKKFLKFPAFSGISCAKGALRKNRTYLVDGHVNKI